jgi:hypothetical protein
MKDYIFKNGLLLGAFLVFLSLISYLFGVDFKLSILWNLIELFAPLSLLIFLMLSYKKMNFGYLKFNQGFVICLGLLAASSFIHTSFKILLFNYIDPSFAVMLQEGSIQQLIEVMSGFFPADVIEEIVTELEGQNSFSVSTLTRGFTSSLFFYVFLSLLIAVIIKKDPTIEIE